MATATTGQLTVTYAELIRRLADEFGDLVMLTATANGNVGKTTFIDTQNVNTGTEDLDGREITFMSGTNAGLSRTITDTTDTTGTLTFAAVTAQTATSDTAEVTNKRGKGFLRSEYKRWINRAIDAAAGLALIEVKGTIGTAFSQSDSYITIPAALSEVFKVEYQGANSEWSEIKKASRWGNDGWTALRGEGKVRIVGAPAAYANGKTVQVWGYGRQDRLSADSDTCAIDTEWLIAWAAYHMAKSNLDRRPDLAQLVMAWGNDMARNEGRLRRNRHPDTVAIR
jgi:hypothetical protein